MSEHLQLFLLEWKLQKNKMRLKTSNKYCYPNHTQQKCRKADRNMVWHHGCKSHNPPPPTPLWLSIICLTISNVVFHRRSSYIKGRLPSKVFFHRKLSSIEGHLPAKVIFHRRWSSIEGCLPLKVVLHQSPSSIKGRLPSNVVFHQRSSSVKCHLPSKVVFH